MRTRFSQYLVARVHEPASCWRENVIAVFILLRDVTMLEDVVVMETSLSNVTSFIILRAGEGLTSNKKISLLTLLVKESKTKLSGMSTF